MSVAAAPDNPDVEAAQELQQQIDDAIQEVSEDVRDRNCEFFEGVESKTSSILRTVESTGRFTEGQRKALENMLDAVRKWIRD